MVRVRLCKMSSRERIRGHGAHRLHLQGSMIIVKFMENKSEKTPSPKEIEKEISDFLAKKFGSSVRMISPRVLPMTAGIEDEAEKKPPTGTIDFDLKPEDLIAYLDQYLIKQDMAKAVLATKICTHFNRIRSSQSALAYTGDMVGRIKNNILMIGPTGVGKTYMVKLIANRIGVPFVKGDATKFSETGYVGGDVEDLVRDLVREADDDIELAQHGIIYIDEVDKIAGSRNIIGADVSRTGVQRALLKPMEETEVELKVPHDPISMFQEIERFRKTGDRKKRTVNTKNILFIMSGAFFELPEIIRKRIVKQGIGFGASLYETQDEMDFLPHVSSEDLIKFGFESEFVGRLPVRAVFEALTEEDLFEILKNPNNPIVLGKKLDFASYGIEIKFDDRSLRLLAKQADQENTGARGLVSAVEKALLAFEKRLPSLDIRRFAVTPEVIEKPKSALEALTDNHRETDDGEFERLAAEERALIHRYIQSNSRMLAEKYNVALTPSRIDMVAAFYSHYIMDIGNVIQRVKKLHDEIKKIELYFYKTHDINIVLEEEAIDYIIEQVIDEVITLQELEKKLSEDFEYGLKLIREKSGRNRFFLTSRALTDPEGFLDDLVRSELKIG